VRRVYLSAGVAALLILPWRATAQIPLFVTGSVGASYDVDDRDPRAGGGFAYLTGVGLWFPRVAFGAEFGQHALGGDRKTKQYGAFVRFPATSGGRVRPFFVAGLADYRYTPASGGKSHALGANVGPGVTVALASERASLLLEARFHASFDRIAAISSQEFLSIMLGLQLGL
jgi:hypothetical protein